MKTLAIINQKGGVGKTTTTINLAHALALRGRQVVLIDLDPQGQLGISLGLSRHDLSGIDDVLIQGDKLADKLIPVRDGIRLVPSGCELIQMEQLTEGGAGRGHRLRLALQDQLSDQDLVLIDCPPASGVLATNALFASTDALLPVAGDFLSLQGLSTITSLIDRLAQRLGRRIRQRIVLTRFHSGRKLSRQTLDSLLRRFPDKLLATPIRETAALAESPGYGQTIFEYEPESNGAQDYAALAGDLLDDRIRS